VVSSLSFDHWIAQVYNSWIVPSNNYFISK
jgi:hypothetical protein